MRLHEWYKCDHCPDFHPVEVHNYAKAFSYNMIFRRSEKEIEEHVSKQKRWRYNLRMEHNLLKRIILTIYQAMQHTQNLTLKWRKGFGSLYFYQVLV